LTASKSRKITRRNDERSAGARNRKIMNANDQVAALNQGRLNAAGIFAINLMASPGAGKTTLILKTIEALAADLRIG
jgi:Ni2+-binding GTPase involved in maturation of urease and hydrogenase